MDGGTGSQSGTPAGGGSKQPDCVLWHPPGVDPPSRLLESLKRRGVAVTDCTSPMLAMATACRRARIRRQAAGDVVPGEDGVILLLVHPSRLDMAADVVEAIDKTVGAVACWRYDEQDQTALRAVTEDDLAAWRQAREAELDAAGGSEPLRPVIVGVPASAVAPRRHGDGQSGQTSAAGRRPPHANGTPTLRLVGDEETPARSDVDDDDGSAEMPQEPDSDTLLTEEELMMLLSSDPTEWEAEPEGEER